MSLLLFFLMIASVAGFITLSNKIKSREVILHAITEESRVASAGEVLQVMSSGSAEADQWADMFGFGEDEKVFYTLFQGVKEKAALGLKGKPFVIKNKDIEAANVKSFKGFFTFDDLEKAVNDDFLDAGRGTTDNRKGWKMATVSNPRGQSFDEARLTFDDVQKALEKGTVIFNSAGAHIPKLAGPSLACSDATTLPNALNMYVTAPQRRTSAPPHTDKQDVVVVQTCGKKHWRVYSPPDPSKKPSADMFARGKGDDDLPLYALESDLGCELLLDVKLEEGDILFVPAAFPHTTDTVEDGLSETSIHLTFGLDTHIWDLDYLSARRWALKRCQVSDTALGQLKDTDNKYVGAINEIPSILLVDVLEELPMGFLDDNAGEVEIEQVSTKLKQVSTAIDESIASKLDDSVWRETVERLQQHGKELLDIHRDMYMAAVDEGRDREAELAMTAHIQNEKGRRALTPEQMQRLSVFRVKKFFDKIEVSSKALMEWGYAGKPAESSSGPVLPENWAFTLPIKVGDTVEADLGGAFFPATISKVQGDKYDVLFFDGDADTGLERGMIKLLTPPVVEEEIDTSKMTPKQLKRWKKQQAKKNK